MGKCKDIRPIEPPIVTGVDIAEVSWVQNFSATGYVWTLYTDEAKTQRFMSLTFDVNGHLTHIDINSSHMPERMPAWKLSEVHEILFENNLCEADHRGEDDLAPEEERAICKYAKEKYDSDFVFVTHFPSEHRAFYAMDDPEDPSLTLSFDLFPFF